MSSAPDTWLFRPARTTDLADICTIIRQAQEQMRRRGSLQWQNGYPAAEHILRDIDLGYGYVLEEGSEIRAYGAIVFDGEPAYREIQGQWPDECPYVVLHRLAVADAVKRRGVAGEFMQRVIDLARERAITSFRVDTNYDNEYMLRLLRKLEFTRCGVIRYDSGERIAFQKQI